MSKKVTSKKAVGAASKELRDLRVSKTALGTALFQKKVVEIYNYSRLCILIKENYIL